MSGTKSAKYAPKQAFLAIFWLLSVDNRSESTDYGSESTDYESKSTDNEAESTDYGAE
jgi:hypothetical protein